MLVGNCQSLGKAPAPDHGLHTRSGAGECLQPLQSCEAAAKYSAAGPRVPGRIGGAEGPVHLLQDVYLVVLAAEVQDPSATQHGRLRGGWGNSSGRASARVSGGYSVATVGVVGKVGQRSDVGSARSYTGPLPD